MQIHLGKLLIVSILSYQQVLNQYVNNPQDSNLVLDLMFLHANTEEFNNHIISLDLQSLSDYASLSVYIIIEEETI